MKLTKIKLKEIIREEIRRLNEAKIQPVYKKFANDISNIIKKHNPDGKEASFRKTTTFFRVMKYMKSKGWTMDRDNTAFWKMKGGGLEPGFNHGGKGVEITDETNSSFFQIDPDGKISGPHGTMGMFHKIEKGNPDHEGLINEFPSGWFI